MKNNQVEDNMSTNHTMTSSTSASNELARNTIESTPMENNHPKNLTETKSTRPQPMPKLTDLHWPLIFGLGALAFVMPFLNISGLMDQLGRPFGPLLTITLISLAWLVTVVLARIRQPILTLTCTGVVYGLVVLVVSALLAPILTGGTFAPLANPFTLPFAVAGILVTNTLWGAAIGVIAWAVQRALATGREA